MVESVYDINYEEIITLDFVKNVTKALEFVTEVYNVACPEILLNLLIEYNVNRILNDLDKKNHVRFLKKYLDWKKLNQLEAFEQFKEIVDHCAHQHKEYNNFKKYKVKINYPNCKTILNHIKFWKEVAMADYNFLDINIVEPKHKRYFYINVMKKKNLAK